MQSSRLVTYKEVFTKFNAIWHGEHYSVDFEHRRRDYFSAFISDTLGNRGKFDVRDGLRCVNNVQNATDTVVPDREAELWLEVFAVHEKQKSPISMLIPKELVKIYIPAEIAKLVSAEKMWDFTQFLYNSTPGRFKSMMLDQFLMELENVSFDKRKKLLSSFITTLCETDTSEEEITKVFLPLLRMIVEQAQKDGADILELLNEYRYVLIHACQYHRALENIFSILPADCHHALLLKRDWKIYMRGTTYLSPDKDNIVVKVMNPCGVNKESFAILLAHLTDDERTQLMPEYFHPEVNHFMNIRSSILHEDVGLLRVYLESLNAAQKEQLRRAKDYEGNTLLANTASHSHVHNMILKFYDCNDNTVEAKRDTNDGSVTEPRKFMAHQTVTGNKSVMYQPVQRDACVKEPDCVGFVRNAKI